jgi:signal transduction histidine kinase
MKRGWRGRLAGLLAWALVAGGGAVWLAQTRLGQLQAAFETDARIVHRLLSQRVVQHDAIMSTLALLPAPASPEAVAQRLSAAYPQILGVLQRPEFAQWPAGKADKQATLAQAERASRKSGHAELAAANLPHGRYSLVMAGAPASYALDIDLRASVPWDEWPMVPATSAVRVALTHEGQAFLVQPGQVGTPGWRYEFHKVLAAPSQPFEVVAERVVGWGELPWLAMLSWGLLTAAVWLVSLAGWRQRIARRRAEELLRLGQAARLNTLGELAAGMAHELNQPLTALLASTQAAQRLLTEAPPDLDTARTALQRAVEQARRASAVVGRLRRLVERPDIASQTQPVPLLAAVHDALHLLESELSKRGITPEVQAAADLPAVQAEPVALQQIIHNLLMNAMQALDQVPRAQRKLLLRLQPQGHQHVLLSVRDHGPGIDAAARRRLFEPFYSTRPGGLGLGLSLCESLAESMGATLTLAPPNEHDLPGAELVLVLLAAHSEPDAADSGQGQSKPVSHAP